MGLSWRTGAAMFACALGLAGAARAASFSMKQVLSYPFVSGLVSAEHADRIAWVRDLRGVRNVWVAEGPNYIPRQVTRYTEDDGQELTNLAFSPDGSKLVYVRGGDHDANWPAKGDLAPDPSSSPEEPKVTVWAADVTGAAAPVKVAEGDTPAISSKGELAYVKDHQVWTAKLDGTGAHRLFFDRGKDEQLTWSPDGSRLAFVSDRDDDHSFVGVFTDEHHPIVYMAPSTTLDGAPVWSPNGSRIAFARRPGVGGAPKPLVIETPEPWSIWTADASTGLGHLVWQSPDTLHGSYPETAGEANLHWTADGRLVFLADLDNWPHLYVVPETGGQARLLTPGPFMVEEVAETPDRRALVYSANTGATLGDDDRRHLFRVGFDGAPPTALTAGHDLEWTPAALGDRVAFIGAGPQQPPVVEVMALDGRGRRELSGQAPPPEFPEAALVAPRRVTFQAADGLTIHGQLFDNGQGAGPKPAVIFVHGGPPRQMLLGWHYMDYYSNSYAVNQYLANHGFVVLSVNYRLGIGYGHDFHHPEHAGPRGAAEYQDVVAGARFLQHTPDVDPSRIGIWGGSYGGYLTAMALAHNSDIFKAGVDMHGVHDWSLFLGGYFAPVKRFEQGDRAEASALAWRSSPDAAIATWTSPVLLIQGDDDRNVNFAQMIDLSKRLQAKGVAFEQMVLPNEIHGFLRYRSWLDADQASADFLARELSAR